jgi:hypothetical protein
MHCDKQAMDEVFERLMQAARGADWSSVTDVTELIRNGSSPQDAQEAQVYLRKLKEAIVVVKASRADLAMSAARLNAAVGFQRSGSGGAACDEDWQNPGIMADF